LIFAAAAVVIALGVVSGPVREIVDDHGPRGQNQSDTFQLAGSAKDAFSHDILPRDECAGQQARGLMRWLRLSSLPDNDDNRKTGKRD
jgi:hypothetical protein